ncbi:MAG: adenylate cyclase [Actinobacteria bacterium]|nr:MAG: adenylate cyclase [Actinomycetota bacterium]
MTKQDKSSETLSPEQLTELLRLIKGADTVELKLSVADENRRSAVTALGMDPLDAEVRQVVFFDTPDLVLDRHGVVVRARRVQRKADDSVVKLRPVVPENLAPSLRRSPAFGVEVDAMPGGFVCSASMKARLKQGDVRDVLAGRRPIRRLFTKAQRALFTVHGPDGVGLDDLTCLGPINVLKLKFSPRGLERRLVAELWNYPDGSRILELSTKCTPGDAFQAAAELRAFLGGRGVDLAGSQMTKTRTALELFSRELLTTAEAK